MRAPSVPSRIEPAVADWRAFAARRYRPFRILAVAQGLIGALTGPAIIIPLLLALGAHPALATALAVLPVVGTLAQRLMPTLLERTDGNLRGIAILFATIGEPRGLLLAAVVGATALGWLSDGVAIAIVAIIAGLLGSLGAVSFGVLQSWYQLVLPEDERRLVAPRLGGITLGIGSLVLLPIALSIDQLVEGIGLWAYAVPLAIGGVNGVVAAFMLRHLPSPGRIRMPRRAAWADETSARLRRLGAVLSLASLAAGLSPFLAVYAITILGTGVGFAIAISAVSSASLVLASLLIGAHLRRGSSSRLLRTSFLLRGGALMLGLAAYPINPFAPALIMLVAVLLAIGDAMGQLAGSERLVRLASGPDVLAFQSHFVVRFVASYSAGLLVGSSVMLLGGYAAFAILFAAAGSVRFVAARTTEVSPRTMPAPAADPIGA